MSETVAGAEAGLPFPFGDWGFDLAPQYARVRAARAPACPVRTVNGDPAWLITRYDLARRVLADPRLSLSAALRPEAPRQEPLPIRLPEGTGDIVTTLNKAGLHHVVADALGPRAVKRHQEWINEQARHLLDALAGPPADLRAGLALRLPFALTRRLLLGDLHQAELVRLNQWADAILSWGPGLSRYATADLAAAQEHIYRFFLHRLPDLAAGSGDHLLKRIAAPGVLDQRDLAVFAASMFLAGYRTSASFLAGALVTLLRHPDALRAVRDDPALVPATAQELLRYTPMATGGVKRLAMREVDLDGLVIKAGDLVLVSLEAANHDPAAFPDPDTFTPGRDASGHLGFGHGSHFCPATAWPGCRSKPPSPRWPATHPPRVWPSPPTTCRGCTAPGSGHRRRSR
ncbi:cytochrome P450 [Actinomadura sp. J1-007]|uniref:cytochrome P450 n=1 Tax=Actinomadura sp. J1-007 TaxID=2661913 RepID=UPI0013234398|nr:cytochrome P450 [Actinomadura sp. J1-007]MWK38386.1 cytochrome P450 [Actinomadura sp. J1-007]